MAKSVKKAAKKAAPKKAALKKAAAKKIVKKAAKKAIAKPAKKAAAKVAKKTPRPALKKAVKAAPKKAPKKAEKKSSPASAVNTGRKFLVIYHAPLEALAQTANMSPEEQDEGMAKWQAWAERCGSKLLDMGAPILDGKRVSSQGDPTASTREVVGYSMLTAEDWDDVMSLLEGHPHISGWNLEATIEIHETMKMPGM